MKPIAALVLTIALMVPATALATSSSTCQAYSRQTCNVLSSTQQAPQPVRRILARFPFTGLDVVLLLIGGGALIGTGLVVRAFTRRVNRTDDHHVEATPSRLSFWNPSRW